MFRRINWLLDISGMVAALDQAVGDITTALEKKGFMDNALLIFTTDVSSLNTWGPGVLDMTLSC